MIASRTAASVKHFQNYLPETYVSMFECKLQELHLESWLPIVERRSTVRHRFALCFTIGLTARF